MVQHFLMVGGGRDRTSPSDIRIASSLADPDPRRRLPRMGYVTSLFARKIVAAAGYGIDASEMLSSVGIDPESAWDTGQMIPAERYYNMLERMAAQIDVTDLPMRASASMRLDEYGALWPAFKAATTLGASYARIERYARLWTSMVEYELRQAKGGTLFILHRAGDRRLGMRLSNEATLASAVSIARQVSPEPVLPEIVLVRHAARNPSPRTRIGSAARSGSARISTRSSTQTKRWIGRTSSVTRGSLAISFRISM